MPQLSSKIRRLLQAILWNSFKTVLLLLFICGLSYWVYHYLSATHRLAFAGKVVDKRTNRFESDYGGRIEHLLILEDENGARSTVAVGEETYARSEMGKWIVRDKNGTKWYDSNPQKK